MKCITCQADIPPAWVNAINKNECPGCGGVIMDDSSKELLIQLREAMAKMPNDPEGLAGWLMSTYDLLPKGTIEPTKFHRKPTAQQMMEEGTDPSTPGLKWANTPTNQFQKRSGADKILKDPKLAAIAQAINSINSADGQMYGDDGAGTMNNSSDFEQSSDINEEEQDVMENQRIAKMAAKAKSQGRKLTMKEVLQNDANSVEFNMGGNEKPLSEAETELVKHLVSGGGGFDPEMDALQNLPPMLQADRLKRLAAQKELRFSGSAGLIKRSE